jgi:DNA-binding NarL/FixJ family response regulator
MTTLMSTIEEALEVAEQFAKRTFAGSPDFDEKVSDVVSVTWEAHVRYGHRVAKEQLARFAIKRVRAKRQFPERSRSLDARSLYKKGAKRRSDFDVFEIAAVAANPAEVAAFRIDFKAWLKTLTAKGRGIAKALAAGETTSEVAERFGITPGAVSQRRRALAASYEAFTADRH